MTSKIPKYIKGKASVLLKNPYINALRGTPLPHVMGEEAQITIARTIKTSGKLIARVGATEGETVAFYLNKRIAKSKDVPPYPDKIIEGMKKLSGFFPCTNDTLDQFSIKYLDYIDKVDVYAAWTPYDKYLCPHNALRCRLYDLDPFFTTNRWTLALEGLNVTVVSPFKTSILAQHSKCKYLFTQPTIPDFKLSVVEAPQTHCLQEVVEQNWDDNLAVMNSAIEKSNPDVVIIGAGAYGLPLAAMAKSRGETAIMLGGATQLLFGIIGSRWLNDPKYKALFNKYWCHPSDKEKPLGYQSLEISGGAYW